MALSSQTVQDKNALVTDAVFLILLKIEIPDTPTVYVTNNNESIDWNSNTYISFPFELEDINENTNSEVPEWTIKLSNANRVMERYLQEYDLYLKTNGIDGNEIKCTICVVNSNDLENTTPILEHNAVLSQPSTNAQWAIFKLSADSPYNKQFPPRKIMKNFCSWKFKSEQCGYSGDGDFCDKTLTTCRSYNNSPRFGGFIGVGGRGLVIA
jgi:phage-related protein